MKISPKVRNLPYRKNVSCIVFKNRHYLLVQLTDWKTDRWKFPQGGVEESETEEETVGRELLEEVGISKIRIVAKSQFTYQYDWPEKFVVEHGFRWRGQDQTFHLVEYLGEMSDVRIPDPMEVKKFQWVTKTELFNLLGIQDKMYLGYKSVLGKIFDEFAKILA